MTKLTLPSGWVITNFGELVVSMSNGYNGTQNKDGIGIPVSRIETIANEFINFNKIGFISKYDDAKIAKYRLKKGEILFSHINSPSHLGKTAIFNSDKKLYHGINLLRMIVEKKIIYPEIFNFYCKFSRSLGNFSLIAQHAVNQSSLNQKKLKIFNIILPPLNEQQRIANKLDQLLAQVDSIKSRIDNIPKILKRFRQSVLNAAVTGKLTEKWRINNSVSISSWTETKIGVIATVATGKTPSKKCPKYWVGGNIPWLTSSLTGNSFCYEAEQFITKLALKECTLKLFEVGTLLMAMYGEGKTRGQVTELKIKATCNQACAAITVDETKTIKEFIKIILIENYEETRRVAAGGAQPNLNLDKVRAIKLILPPIEEQTEIVKRVESLFAFADQVEQRVKDAQARINNLTQSILAKAFRGELVPQDPNDEPASELLKRIRQERQQAIALAKAAKKATTKTKTRKTTKKTTVTA